MYYIIWTNDPDLTSLKYTGVIILNLNPMYQKTKPKLPPTERQYMQPSRPRKERSDKKKDIKVPLTEEQKRMVRWGAYQREMTATSFSTTLVEKALSRPYLKELTEIPYEDTYDYVHVKLSKTNYEVVVKLSILWNVSIRKGVHRILLFMLGDEIKNE